MFGRTAAMLRGMTVVPRMLQTPRRSRPMGAPDTPPKPWWRCLGPGFISGASDNDPSSIATYWQAGAGLGYALLWVIPFALPMIIAVQEISARIGRTTGRGLAGNIRRNYPAWVLYPLVLLLAAANTITLGADVGAMGASLRLLAGGSAIVWSVLFAIICVVVQVFFSYQKFANLMKWLALVLLTYIYTAARARVNWPKAIHHTFVPTFRLDPDYVQTIVAVLGTTISPYLFFWQASLETEEIRSAPDAQPLKHDPTQARRQLRRIRIDTFIGMGMCALVSYCIVVTAAGTLFHSRGEVITTATQAAKALGPLLGASGTWVFAIGIIGTGLMAVPVFAGSAAYAVGEALKWPTGFDRKPLDAKGFYGVLATATLIGLAINFPAFHVNPIRALFFAAMINGVAAVPLLIMMLLMFQNKQIMGQFTRMSKVLRAIGWITTIAMAAVSAGLIWTLLPGRGK